MTTVRDNKGRKYEVRSTLYGTLNLVHRLYFGGIFLAATGSRGLNNGPDWSMEDAIAAASEAADRMGIEITE